MRNGNSKTGSICTKICSVEFLKDLLCCVFGACAMFVSSIIKIPFVYVPFTLQTLAVVLLSVFFGKKTHNRQLVTIQCSLSAVTDNDDMV